jgi:hypothetical protein
VSKKNLILAGVFLLVIAAVWLRFRPVPVASEPMQPPVPSVAAEEEVKTDKVLPTDDGLAPQTSPPADLSIQTMIKSTDYNRRIQVAVNDLPAKLGAENRAAVETYLITPQDGKDGDFRQHEYALRNFMMDALRADPDQIPETISTFIDVYKNEQQGDVMRGYTLQHLCSVYLDHSQTLSTGDKQRIIETFTAALSDTSGETLAGTALTGLHEAARADSATVSGSAVEAVAMKLLNTPESGTLSKISAFQICGERKVSGAEKLARKTAMDTSADWVLRMSAVYALGQLGQTAGLEPLLNDSDKNVSHAARIALNAQR